MNISKSEIFTIAEMIKKEHPGSDEAIDQFRRIIIGGANIPQRSNKNTLNGMIDKVQSYVNKYIRLRDLQIVDGKIIGACISCENQWVVQTYSNNSIMNGRQWHAGHYFNTDQYESVRFDEDNIHLQCNRCNHYKSGNKTMFKDGLLRKIGDDRFDSLQLRKNIIHKYQFNELEFLLKEYQHKCKTEARRLGIKHY